VSLSTLSFIKYWLPVVLWLILIFAASTDLMSGEHTSRFLVPFLRWFSPGISTQTIALIQLVIRKCAHLTEYAVLAALLWRALRGQLLTRRARAHATFAFFAGITFAVLDEFHQSFVPSRTSSPYDVVIDAAGAIIGLLIYRRMTRTQCVHAARPLNMRIRLRL
jgi:VanZ family protein